MAYLPEIQYREAATRLCSGLHQLEFGEWGIILEGLIALVNTPSKTVGGQHQAKYSKKLYEKLILKPAELNIWKTEPPTGWSSQLGPVEIIQKDGSILTGYMSTTTSGDDELPRYEVEVFGTAADGVLMWYNWSNMKQWRYVEWRTLMQKLDMEKDEKLIGRLFNQKFRQAEEYLRKDHPDETYALVKALAAAFGNSGIHIEGAIGTIIDVALSTIMPDDRGDIVYDP